MKIFFLFIAIILLNCSVVYSCDCPPLQTLNKEYCESSDLIFIGIIDSVSVCNEKAVAYFNVEELYKGKSFARCEINFDCSTSCQMSMSKGDRWIIYAYYAKYAVPEISFCGRSRKQFENSKDDYYETTHQLSFIKEKETLTALLGVQPLLQCEETSGVQRELIKPKGFTVLWLLLFSVAGLTIMLYLGKAFKK